MTVALQQYIAMHYTAYKWIYWRAKTFAYCSKNAIGVILIWQLKSFKSYIIYTYHNN